MICDLIARRPTAGRIKRRRLNALAAGANPHTQRARRAVWKAASVVSAIGLALAAACDRPTGATGDSAASTAAIAELVAAHVPPAPTSTSDLQDAWFQRKADLIERMRAGPPELGRAALREFSDVLHSELASSALLDVGAHCAPADAAPMLARLITTYDSKVGLGLRTFAVDLLARTSPAKALELCEPILLEAQPRETRPPQESFVRAWALAARAVGGVEPRVLCDVAVDLAQPADARYAAIDELGGFGGKRAQKALEEVLREANSDGLMRRKAAQALAEFAPKAELCAALEAASQHESDENFLYFLASMIARHCGG